MQFSLASCNRRDLKRERKKEINRVSVDLSLIVVDSRQKDMVSVSSAAVRTTASTPPGHGVSDETTKDGVGRCTVVLVPEKEW